MKQLKRPTSLISHWLPVEMVHNGPKLCKRKLFFPVAIFFKRYPDMPYESWRPGDSENVVVFYSNTNDNINWLWLSCHGWWNTHRKSSRRLALQHFFIKSNFACFCEHRKRAFFCDTYKMKWGQINGFCVISANSNWKFKQCETSHGVREKDRSHFGWLVASALRESRFSRILENFFWNFTSRSRVISISLSLLDLDFQSFRFHFHFSKRVKGEKISYFSQEKGVNFTPSFF